MKKLLVTCGLILGTCLAPAVASAQARGNTGNTGNTGNSNTGASAFGSTGSSAFGSTGSSGLGGSSPFGSTGSGGLGSTGFGQGTNGQTGMGGQNQRGANRAAGGILGRNTNQNQGILGRNVQNQGGGNNGQGGGRGGGGNRGNNGNNGLNALNGGGGNGGNSNQMPLVRPRQKVAFDFPQPKSSAIQTTLETRLTKLSLKNPGMKSVMVTVEDKGEVVLSGEVATESESKLAANLMRFEPGVRTIRNELTFPVAASPTDE